MSDQPDPTHSQATIRRLKEKIDRAELRLANSLRKVKKLLPSNSQINLKITPDVSIESLAVGVDQASKPRIPSDASTTTVWSCGDGIGGERVSPMSVVIEGQ